MAPTASVLSEDSSQSTRTAPRLKAFKAKKRHRKSKANKTKQNKPAGCYSKDGLILVQPPASRQLAASNGRPSSVQYVCTAGDEYQNGTRPKRRLVGRAPRQSVAPMTTDMPISNNKPLNASMNPCINASTAAHVFPQRLPFLPP
ncbi:uncharacterized protein BKA78DRAFT_91654 [Phyllosticta capitalensis]|uniref:uncharacterized protein n=1 Tax=Phyllosticta capitalensis TaxID=121624 RepID=UPI00312FCCE6